MYKQINLLTADKLELFDVIKLNGEYVQITGADPTGDELELFVESLDMEDAQPVAINNVDPNRKFATYDFIPE